MVEEKVDATENSPAVPEKDAKIIHQIEYYFGDINLPKDKFLLEQIKADDGWIPLETMIKFKKLASLTTDLDEIASAVKKSTSGLMEVDQEKKKIRRSPSVPVPEMNEERRKELISRSAYVRRFPLDHTIDKILGFCDESAPEYENVIMRNYQDKAENKWCFKGSIFVTFKTVEACKKFVDGPELEYNGVKLEKMMQNDYNQEKRKEKIDEREAKKKLKKNGAQPSQQAETKGKEGKEESDNEERDEFPLGAVVNLTGFKDDSKTKRETIKTKIEEYGIAVAFIDFNIGEQTAWVRLAQKDAAKELAKKVAEEGEKMKVGDDELTVRVLEGEEEAEFLVKAKEQLLKRKANNQRFKKSGRKGGRKFGRGKKRGGSPAPRRDQKKARTE